MTRESTVFEWLRSGVPLSLLIDLASPDGPDSRAIARHEGEHPPKAVRSPGGCS